MKKGLAILVCLTLLFLCACDAPADNTPPSAQTGTEAPVQKPSPPVPEKPLPEQTMGVPLSATEIDVAAVLSHIDRLLGHTGVSLESKAQIEQQDLFYYLCEMIIFNDNGFLDPRVKRANRDDGSNYSYLIDADLFDECLYNNFGIGPEYLDRYKDGTYDFRSRADAYDTMNDKFRLAPRGWGWNGEPVDVSGRDTKITINGNRITVKTVLTPKTGEQKSADYEFLAHRQEDGQSYYQLAAVQMYDDDRNVNKEIILTVDEISFPVQWYTVDREGALEYYIPESGQEQNAASLYDPSYESTVQMRRTGRIKDKIAYLGFEYYDIIDTYVYDIEAKTGYWLSGAEDLGAFYKKEVEAQRKLRGETNYGNSWGPYYYRTHEIVALSESLDYALLRRSKVVGELPGEYWMRNLVTGEEVYICESYTTKELRSSMAELFFWEDDNSLLIEVWLEDGEAWYETVYDGETWHTTQTTSPY